jgi:hypothetical protein
MSRFGALKEEAAARSAPATAKTPAPISTTSAGEPVPTAAPKIAKARVGKKPVMGYFSPELWRTLHQMVLDGEASSIQALLGEGIDLLMRSKGRHPFGER